MMTTIFTMSEVCCGAKRTGESHKERNKRCEDAVLAKEYPFGVILAVSDGVGSHRYARTGANAIVRAVHMTFTELAACGLHEEKIGDRIVRHYAEIVPANKHSQAAATCLYAAHLYGIGLFIGQAGDGMICCETEGKQIKMEEPKTESRNEVSPVISDPEKVIWRTEIIEDQNIGKIRLMLMTDGISEEIVPGKEHDMMNFLEEKLSVRKNKQNRVLKLLLRKELDTMSKDDKTIAVYCRG